MKALTLWQPYASLMVGSFKTYETRSWSTKHRGWLAIHAAKKEPDYIFDMINPHFEYVNKGVKAWWECLESMGYSGWRELPRGAVIGLVKIDGIYQTETIRDEIGLLNKTFGDWRDGRFAWRTDTLATISFSEPISAKGSQRLWEWNPPDWVIEEMRQ